MGRRSKSRRRGRSLTQLERRSAYRDHDAYQRLVAREGVVKEHCTCDACLRTKDRADAKRARRRERNLREAAA